MLALLASLAFANEQPTSTVNGWEVNQGIGGCHAVKFYSSNRFIQISHNLRDGLAQFDLFDFRRHVINADDINYSIILNFSNGSYYETADGYGLVGGESSAADGYRMFLEGAEFMEDFSDSASVSVTVNGRELATLNLRGTRQAIQALRRCAERAFSEHPGDPHAGLRLVRPLPTEGARRRPRMAPSSRMRLPASEGR